jgi:hypothetical protein
MGVVGGSWRGLEQGECGERKLEELAANRQIERGQAEETGTGEHRSKDRQMEETRGKSAFEDTRYPP